MPGPTELIILLVIVLVIFGGGKLAGIGKSLGTAISEFKDAVTTKDETKPEDPHTNEKTT
jgi:sec-independent protein translocase protein TatA